jgi:Caspase domain
MRRTLAVGINKYPTAPLRGCVNDASALGSVMETNGDGSPNFDVRLATDVESKSKLAGLIKELFSGDCETALFYFSGHGFLNELGGYIVTPDARQHDEGVSMDDILKIANNSEVKNKIIILDCCHSGAMGSPKLGGGVTAQIVPGVTILTASKDIESAIEINGHGIFTNLLLDGLQGGASDLRGHITPGSVYAYIDQALGPWDQRPVFKTNITQFTSLRTVAPQVPIDILRKLIEYFPVASHSFPLDPEYEYTYPKCKPEKIVVFRYLQRFESVGLVVPTDEEHMYWAAMNSKSCKLTALGYHYWRLVKNRRL